MKRQLAQLLGGADRHRRRLHKVTRLEDSSRQNKTTEFPPVGMNEEEDNDFV